MASGKAVAGTKPPRRMALVAWALIAAGVAVRVMSFWTHGLGIDANRYAAMGQSWAEDRRVPHDHDLVFRHGRVFGVSPLGAPLAPPSPSPPTETVEVGGGYDRISFGLILGGGRFQGLPQEVTPGYFAERLTAPDGTVYELALAPGEGDLKIQYFGHELPAGPWSMQHTAAGAGFAFAEGIGYHSIDVDLPSGCVVASANAQHHGAGCRA